jgi:ubiquinone/menaquinone biosynthesis C-methylase UbiE
MVMNDTPAFDAIARVYDKNFSQSLVGQKQREVSRHWLKKLLNQDKKLKILEISCGTGDDALWLGSLGHWVVATDQSRAMIEQAKQKLKINGQKHVRFIACDFKDLSDNFKGQEFDIIFSNFSGLNCISPKEVAALGRQLFGLLKPGGHLALVVFGKYTWWETFFYLLKAQPGNAFRRWGNKDVTVTLAQDVYQRIHYYSVQQLKKSLAPLRLIEKKPVGLFIPPSYLDAAMKKRPGFFRTLTRLERTMNGLSVTSSFADHVFLVFKKEEA